MLFSEIHSPNRTFIQFTWFWVHRHHKLALNVNLLAVCSTYAFCTKMICMVGSITNKVTTEHYVLMYFIEFVIMKYDNLNGAQNI